MIRELEPGDAAEVVDVLRATHPLYLGNVAVFRHRLEHVPEEARRRSWVAVDGDRIVGYGVASIRFWTSVDDSGTADVSVRAEARGRGIGSALYELCEAHLREIGARRAWAAFMSTDEGDRFARSHGFEPARLDKLSGLDPRAFAGPVPQLDGFRAAALAEIRDRPRAIFDVEKEVVADIPLTEPFALDYDRWLRDDWRDPLLDFDVSTVVLHEDRVVAFAQVRVDRETGRGDNSFTACVRAFRGRGLATLAKARSLRAAAELGITSMTTANDERNAAMLAVNRRLGYAPIGTRIEWCREL